MKNGDPFKCPGCGEDSILKLRRKMDGFRCTGEVLCCMLCGAEIAPVTPAAPEEKTKPDPLAAMLGVKQDAPLRLEDDGMRRFCRDCRHYIHHPFLSRCDRHGRAVDPMGDCPDFLPPAHKEKQNPGTV